MNDIDVEPTVGERVLIVEDDPATRSGLAELVQAWGFQTAEAADGEEAMRKVTTFRPAIIVSDLVMPRMIQKAKQAITAVNCSSLPPARKTVCENANLTLKQAEEALSKSDFENAKKLAQKVEDTARELGAR